MIAPSTKSPPHKQKASQNLFSPLLAILIPFSLPLYPTNTHTHTRTHTHTHTNTHTHTPHACRGLCITNTTQTPCDGRPSLWALVWVYTEVHSMLVNLSQYSFFVGLVFVTYNEVSASKESERGLYPNTLYTSVWIMLKSVGSIHMDYSRCWIGH